MSILNILVIVALLIYGVFFTGAAVLKLTRHSHMVEEFVKMKLPYGLAYLSGAVEIFAGPALIAGVWYPAIGGIAATVMIPTMIGASIVNFIGRTARSGFGVLVLFCLPMVLLALHFSPTTKAFLGL